MCSGGKLESNNYGTRIDYASVTKTHLFGGSLFFNILAVKSKTAKYISANIRHKV